MDATEPDDLPLDGTPPEPRPRRSLAELAAEAREPSGVSPGLECPGCGCRHFLVVYTRRKPGHIERRRQCRHCGRRITTWEREVGKVDKAS